MGKYFHYFLLLILSIFLLIALGYYLAKFKGESKQKDQVIKVKNDVIFTKKVQQKIISNPAVNDDIAYRNEWMQLIWKKRDNL